MLTQSYAETPSGSSNARGSGNRGVFRRAIFGLPGGAKRTCTGLPKHVLVYCMLCVLKQCLGLGFRNLKRVELLLMFWDKECAIG